MRISIIILFVALIFVGCKSTQVNQTTSLTKKETRLKQSIFNQGYSFVAYNSNERWRLFFNPDSVFVWIAPTYKNHYEVTHMADQFPNQIENYVLAGMPVKLVQITDSVCVDTLANESFPYQVTLKTDSLTLHGCGYNIYDMRINGKWTLVKINGKNIPSQLGQNIPFIDVNGEENRVSGSTGCNRFNGKFVLRNYKIHMGNLATTKMACANAMESAFLAVFNNLDSYQINNTTLLLTNKEGITCEFTQTK